MGLSQVQEFVQQSAGRMVFQRFNLFSHMTVLENLIEAPVTLRISTCGEAIQTARALLARVGLSSKENY